MARSRSRKSRTSRRRRSRNNSNRRRSRKSSSRRRSRKSRGGALPPALAAVPPPPPPTANKLKAAKKQVSDANKRVSAKKDKIYKGKDNELKIAQAAVSINAKAKGVEKARKKFKSRTCPDCKGLIYNYITNRNLIKKSSDHNFDTEKIAYQLIKKRVVFVLLIMIKKEIKIKYLIEK